MSNQPHMILNQAGKWLAIYQFSVFQSIFGHLYSYCESFELLLLLKAALQMADINLYFFA